ncbi:MAG: hypothetical protein JWL95_2989 [Gemmatimonadetes bacterium]|nr:hypothetical protein [Gemmatimonadota bacterium]
MTRHSKVWKVVGVLFTLFNLAYAGVAASGGERPHAAAHLALAVLGAGVLWWLGQGSPKERLGAELADQDRLDYLQQSVDAVALEVERVGEAQRFADKLRVERSEPRSGGGTGVGPAS